MGSIFLDGEWRSSGGFWPVRGPFCGVRFKTNPTRAQNRNVAASVLAVVKVGSVFGLKTPGCWMAALLLRDDAGGRYE